MEMSISIDLLALVLIFIDVSKQIFVSGERTLGEMHDGSLNTRPLIGVPAMSITDKLLKKKMPDLKGRSYIAASYVKYLEMAGARVIPIPPNLSKKEEKMIFKSINGLLFTGGEVNLAWSKYKKLTERLFKWAVKANKRGDFFPILGICRGMQALLVHTVGDLTPLTLTDARNYTAALKWSKGFNNSELLRDIPDKILKTMESKKETAHFHKYGALPKIFKKVAALKDRFSVIATSKDRNGIEFASIIEGKELPFYGLQFHPEKPIFEWAQSITIPHSFETIKFSQLMVDNFVQAARRNKHRPINDEIEKMYTIYLQNPLYIGFLKNSHSPFEQIYVY